ncbi:MAG: NADH:flavin oxidoreductase [Pseudomonadota bacterium]
MWKPAERIKFEARTGKWPNAQEARHSKLFSPIKIRTRELSSRTWVPAMVPWRATEDGFVTSDVIDWYERFAMGRPGAIVVEATGVRDVPSGPLLRAGHERFIDGLKKLVDAVKTASAGETALYIQLIDFLAIKRRPQREKFLQRFLAITDSHRKSFETDLNDQQIRDHFVAMDDEQLRVILSPREFDDLTVGFRERVTDTGQAHIRDLPAALPEIFLAAANRAEQAGFDGVELHYAHAYTMASFLSARNTRDDGYGGSKENRVKLPLEVFNAVRAGVSNDFAVGCRFLSQDCIQDGTEIQDSCYFGEKFAEAGMDFLSLSRGGKFEDAKQPKVGWAAYPYTGPSGYECMPQYISDEQGPFGRNVEPVSQIRARVRAAGCDTPVVVAGGIHNFEQAEEILAKDQADIVGLARQAMADPDWFKKVREGFGSQVRLCEYTNYCEGLDQKHKQVTCQLWDRLELDGTSVTLSEDGKRRLVAPLWKTPN